MSIKKSQELKQLQSRKSKLEVKIKDLQKTARESQSDYDKAMGQMKFIDKDIKSLATVEVVVSEHAMLRYMERVMGFDLEIIRSAILSPDNLLMIKKLGSGRFPLSGGGRMVVRDKTVVSIVD